MSYSMSYHFFQLQAEFNTLNKTACFQALQGIFDYFFSLYTSATNLYGLEFLFKDLSHKHPPNLSPYNLSWIAKLQYLNISVRLSDRVINSPICEAFSRYRQHLSADSFKAFLSHLCQSPTFTSGSNLLF